MKLSQNLIKCRHRMMIWHILELILNGFARQFLILFDRTILAIKIIEVALDIVLELLRWNLEFTEWYESVEVTISLIMSLVITIFCLHGIRIALA